MRATDVVLLSTDSSVVVVVVAAVVVDSSSSGSVVVVDSAVVVGCVVVVVDSAVVVDSCDGVLVVVVRRRLVVVVASVVVVVAGSVVVVVATVVVVVDVVVVSGGSVSSVQSAGLPSIRHGIAELVPLKIAMAPTKAMTASAESAVVRRREPLTVTRIGPLERNYHGGYRIEWPNWCETCIELALSTKLRPLAGDKHLEFDNEVFAKRVAQAQEQLEIQGVDALLVSLGSELPYLVGAKAMPLERLTMLVVTPDSVPELIVPELEAPLMTERPGVFSLRPWKEGAEPLDDLVSLLGDAKTVAFGDHAWAQFLVGLMQRRPDLALKRSADILGPLRMIKSPVEMAALRNAAAAADRIIARLQQGDIAVVGRTEADVSRQIADLLVEEGHEYHNFAIVASGPNAASPHHHSSDRKIEHGDGVLFDIGGTMDGYCSDITRCVYIGEPSAEFQKAYDVLFEAQAAGVAAATVGTSFEDIDAASRQVIEDAGYGEYFIHRVGHGIGMDAHEDPYLVRGNKALLEAGHCFSIEPGIYIEGQFGMRLEDIVIAHVEGPEPINLVPHELLVV